jgi:hypothetical protein
MVRTPNSPEETGLPRRTIGHQRPIWSNAVRQPPYAQKVKAITDEDQSFVGLDMLQALPNIRDGIKGVPPIVNSSLRHPGLYRESGQPFSAIIGARRTRTPDDYDAIDGVRMI